MISLEFFVGWAVGVGSVLIGFFWAELEAWLRHRREMQRIRMMTGELPLAFARGLERAFRSADGRHHVDVPKDPPGSDKEKDP